MTREIVDAVGLDKVAQALKQSEAAAIDVRPDPGSVLVKLFNEVKAAQREYLKAKESCAECKKRQADALTAEAKAADALHEAKKKLDALVDAE